MCGLVGMMGDLLSRHKDMMADLLFLDTLRGADSTGVACIRSNGDVHVAKSTIPGYEFIQTAHFKDGLRLTDDIWIGHNRYGTVGKTHKMNAHPFLVEDEEGDPVLVGAHNGTLKNKWELDPHPAKFGTDSEALFNVIANEGPKKTLAKTEGAWALSWFDWYEDALFFIRNKERPLTFAYAKDKKTFFWASEAWMLRTAAARNGVELDVVYNMNEDTLYRAEIPERKGDRVIADLKVEGGLVGKPTPTFQGGQADRSWWRDNSHQKGTQTPPKTGSTIGSPTSSSKGVQQVRGFQGKFVDLPVVELLLSSGCVWCEDPIKREEPFIWIGDNEPVCSRCLKGTHYDGQEEPKKVILTEMQQAALRRVDEVRARSNLSSVQTGGQQ